MISTGGIEVIDVDTENKPNSVSFYEDGWMTTSQIMEVTGISYGNMKFKLKALRNGGFVEHTQFVCPVTKQTVQAYRHPSGSKDWKQIVKGKYAFVYAPEGWVCVYDLVKLTGLSTSHIQAKLRRSGIEFVTTLEKNIIAKYYDREKALAVFN